MGIRRRLVDGACMGVLVTCGGAVACGGTDASGSRARAADASSEIDANQSAPYPDDASPPDASVPCAIDCDDGAATPDGTRDGGGDAPGDSPDADADLATTDSEVCHVEWPQVYGFNAAPSEMQVAVDPAGNAFVSISHGDEVDASDDDPPLDLGVSSPRYPQGFVVAKIDPECNLVWAREFGAAHVSGSSSATVGLALDANADVTVLGAFTGAAELGAGVVDAGPVITDDAGNGSITYDSFLLRLDTRGNVVFSKVFQASGGWVLASSLAVTPDGTTTIVAAGSSGADFGSGPVMGTDPGSLGNHYLAQFDATGSVSRAVALPDDGPTVQQLLADPAGGLWAYGSAPSDAGATPSMMRLDSAGDLVWSRPLASGTGFAVNASGEVSFASSSAGSSPVSETLMAYSPDGTPTSSHVTLVDYLGPQVAEQIVTDAMGEAFVGGNFEGTVVDHPDGSFTQTPAPAGAGFQRFDPAGVLRSVTAWGGANAQLGSMAPAQNGNVVLLGLIAQPTISAPPPTLFLVRFAAP